jgi:hypothetical protein
MGLLRAAMSQPLKQLIVAEVMKDLMHEPETVVLSHLPADIVSARAHLAP